MVDDLFDLAAKVPDEPFSLTSWTPAPRPSRRWVVKAKPDDARSFAWLDHAPLPAAPPSVPFELVSPGIVPAPVRTSSVLRGEIKRVIRTPRWERCVACDAAFSEARPPKRWYGLCLPCYRSTTQDERAFYNNVTQRWRKAALRDFGKHDTDSLPVWTTTPTPIQVMLLRLAHAFGLTTPPGCEGTLCEGLDRRLNCPPEGVDAAIRGWRPLAPESRRLLVAGALDWLAADEAHCAAMAEEYPDEDIDAVPDDEAILAVAAVLRRELGRSG